jgi:integrase
MTNPKFRHRGIIKPKELDVMLKKADKIEFEYFRLRVKALIALVKKFGKRRAEIASLKREDLKIENNKLLVTFTLRKKHKRGFHQFIKFLEKNEPKQLEKPLSELKLDHEEWTLTNEGYRVKKEFRTKSVDVKDKYAHLIIEYLDFLNENYPEAKYVFPSGQEVFGSNYVVFWDRHLSGRQLLRLIKPLSETVWLHLFRETKGAEIAREKGRTLDAVYEIRETLDLENEETAYRYVRRYAVQEMKSEK